MKIILKIIFLFVVFLFVSAGVFYYYNLPVSRTDEEVFIIEIEKGETLRSISEKLEESNLIRSNFLMMAISKVMGTEQKMKSGQYGISRTMDAMEIHQMIVSGSALLYKVTIPEGITASKVASILEAAKITDKENFLNAVVSSDLIRKFNIASESLEGYLFPDSYMFPHNYPAEKVVSYMVSNFFKKLAVIYPEYKNISFRDINNHVIVASIIEREYRVAEEAPIIASVFFNRLNIRMHLGSCATVEYIITEIQKKPHPEYLTYADIGIESDYNTYIRYGLPPTPISNPGKVALTAAFYPANTNYLYFVLKDKNSGEHFFSTRYSDHNNAKILYLKN
ncbi:MAG: endolytic transglycosylase MltG [Spirochaetaceae bacterium]|nr:endolytic transglycosylase MltG [Spirochaetaceae bacterium]